MSIDINTELLQKLDLLKNNINKVFIGQEDVIHHTLVALFANGHILIEGVPGLGKTLLVRCLSASINADYRRVQFTPDLMPADIIGHTLYDMKNQKFTLRKGPAFTSFLLADEINRSPAKTQAALLEVMQERQITIDNHTFPSLRPFMVMATQNPLEHEGTYSLPEAELDRFLMKILIDYPSKDEEILLTQMATSTTDHELKLDAVISSEDVISIQQAATELLVDDQLFDYAVRICQATREHPGFLTGAGPRASIALIRCARTNALLNQKNYVLPDDIKSVALPVLRHRVRLAPDVELEGMTADTLITQLLNKVEAPRQ